MSMDNRPEAFELIVLPDGVEKCAPRSGGTSRRLVR